MTITMSGTRMEGVSFKAEGKAEAYDWVEEQLYRYKYDRLDKSSEMAFLVYDGRRLSACVHFDRTFRAARTF